MPRKKRLIPAVIAMIFLLLPVLESRAQDGNSCVIMRGDTRLRAWSDAMAERAGSKPTLAGYRVQIWSGSQRSGALEARRKCQELFPEMQADLIFEYPNYKIRVGNYTDRFGAYHGQSRLRTAFSGAFIVPERIVVAFPGETESTPSPDQE